MDYSKLLRYYMAEAEQAKASDIHLKPERPGIIRANGVLKSVGTRILSNEDIVSMADLILNDVQRQTLEKEKDVDFSFSLDGKKRCRCNAYQDMHGLSLAIRRYSDEKKDFKQLGIPEVLKELSMKKSGFILITGPTGSGKTTTLATVLDYINTHRSGHIITIEDPIEFVFESEQCLVTQREINNDTPSFAAALKAVLRQDPDIIVLGEMRDLESIGTALTAAETGHLVLATMHTTGAVNAVDRIIDSFPSDQQNQVRMQLSMVLTCVVSQQLIPSSVAANGRVLATEVMVGNAAVRSLIRQNRLHMIQNTMLTSGPQGMYTLNQSLESLYKKGLISSADYKVYVAE